MSRGDHNSSDAEKYLLQLENNVKELREALQHWQTWDAEYEALKEEVEAIPEPTTPDHLRRARNRFDAEFLVGKEIDEIFGLQHARNKHQIINVLQRRIDYVSKNVASLEKQLETAETNLTAATIGGQAHAQDANGQNVTEIVEHLDDDDNVLSYQLNQPSDIIPKVTEALEEVGIKHAPEGTSVQEEKPSRKELLPNGQQLQPRSQPSLRPSSHASINAPPVEDIASLSEHSQLEDSPSPEISRTAERVERIVQTAKEQESIGEKNATTPEDEDSDDATLRQTMLSYSSGDVKAIVAELEIAEDEDTDDDSFEPEEDDWDDVEDDDDEEDRYGRFTGRMVTDKYQQRMLELEQRLGIRSQFTESAAQKQEARTAEDARGDDRTVVKSHGMDTLPSASKSLPSKSSIKDKKGATVDSKKGVRFAQVLDVATGGEAAMQTMHEEQKPIVGSLTDVIERTALPTIPAAEPAQRPSRFKRAQYSKTFNNVSTPKGPKDVPPRFSHDETFSVPQGPNGSTLADQLVEHDSSSHVAIADEADDMPTTYKATAAEYHRLRRKFSQREGGFFEEEDVSEVQNLDELDGGEKISRFRAARLSRQ